MITPTHRKVFDWMVRYGDSKMRRLYETPMIAPGRKLRLMKKALDQNIDLEV